MTEFRIGGERVTLPVEVHDATAACATFAVAARRAQEAVAYSGLEVLRPFPGKALCALIFVDYADGDLGTYHEFGVAFLVRQPRTAPRRAGVFIHRLPVDEEFSRDAGRTIWGFPKQLNRIDLDRDEHGRHRCVLREGEDLVAGLAIRPGLPVPAGAAGVALDAYTHLDGRLRRTPWTMRPGGVRTRRGGAALVLGSHPLAAELHALGLPKRALASTTIGRLRMTFGAASEQTA